MHVCAERAEKLAKDKWGLMPDFFIGMLEAEKILLRPGYGAGQWISGLSFETFGGIVHENWTDRLNRAPAGREDRGRRLKRALPGAG